MLTVAEACALAVALSLAAPPTAPTAAPDAWTVCMTGGAAPRSRIADCTRVLGRTDLSRFHRSLLTSARGDAYLDLGRDREAVADYDRAVRLDPRESDTYASRGEAKEDLHLLAAAERDYGEAIRVYLAQPNNAHNGTADVLADAYALRGRVRLAAGRPRQALADFRRALRIYPAGATTELRELVRQASHAARPRHATPTTAERAHAHA